ncbi:MAG: hypothetical protein IKP48_03545 [Bacteroidaceae bacterium]|nr:hypothetical protein [Bacteroidaceae bacterium]
MEKKQSFKIFVVIVIFATVIVSLYNVQGGPSHSKTRAELSEKENIPSLFGISMQGVNQDEIIKNMVEKTEEFDYFGNEREGIKRVLFCGVPCGLNIQFEQKNGTTVITHVVLFTSLQDKATFDNLKSSISKKYGNPDLEEYEEGTEVIDGRYYGKCRWNNGEIMLRNTHRDEGGFLVFLYPVTNMGHSSRKTVTTKSDSCIKTKFTWEDSHGNLFPVYMTSKGSCFVIRTSKNGENYRAYLGKEVSEQICRELEQKMTQANDSFLFNEVTLDDNRTYYNDVDFDNNVEKIERKDNGEILVYKADNKGKCVIDVSSDIPYCWIRINLCCPAHKAYTTINYKMQTIYVEAHYGCNDCQINQYKKIGDTWREVLPVKPLSLINLDLFPKEPFYWDEYKWCWRIR